MKPRRKKKSKHYDGKFICWVGPIMVLHRANPDADPMIILHWLRRWRGRSEDGGIDNPFPYWPIGIPPSARMIAYIIRREDAAA